MYKATNELLLNKSRILARISSTMEQEIKKGLKDENKLTLIYRKINDIKQIMYWFFFMFFYAIFSTDRIFCLEQLFFMEFYYLLDSSSLQMLLEINCKNYLVYFLILISSSLWRSLIIISIQRFHLGILISNFCSFVQPLNIVFVKVLF